MKKTDCIEQLKELIGWGHSPYHVVAAVEYGLQQEGFEPLLLNRPREL